MTSAVGTITAGSGVTPAQPPVLSAQTSNTGSSASTSSANLQNPRVVFDPSAGVVTEYLNQNGSQVVSQFPSSTVVNYLRQGLTADGLAKQGVNTNTTA